MNKKEAETIAWEIYKIIDCAENVTGEDRACVVAHSALDAIDNITKTHPKIKTEIDNWRAGG